VAEDHGVLDDELADCAGGPVVDLAYNRVSRMTSSTDRTGCPYITATDSSPIDCNKDIVRGREFWDWTVFEFDLVRFLEHEGEVLRTGVSANHLL
jgi:hypothetical protein